MKEKEKEISDLLQSLKQVNRKIESLKEKALEDFEYLLHHIVVNDDGEEEIHHCYVYDHIANIFEQGHLLIRDNKAFLNGKSIKSGNFHVIVGLESKQQIVWSDEEAIKNKIKPKKMIAGMTFKQKAKEWR